MEKDRELSIKVARGLKIEFTMDLAYDKNKKGKLEVVKDQDGQEQYFRNDLMGLMSLLGKLDTRLHILKDLKMWTKLRDKFRKCYFDGLKEAELSLDEAKFLKDYLKEIQTRDSKDRPLAEFEIRTLLGILEQLGEE